MKLFTNFTSSSTRPTRPTKRSRRCGSISSARHKHDAAWAFYFLSGRKPRQIVPSKFLREWALEMSGIPEWLYLESRDTVGDGAETTALLLPNITDVDETPLHTLVEEQLLPLRGSRRGNAEDGGDRSMVADELFAAARLQQTDLRSVSRRRFAAARRPGFVAIVRIADRCHRPSSDGRLEPTPEFFDKLLSPNLASTKRRSPGRFLFIWRTRSISRRRISARFRTGRPNGNGTAFVHR